MEERVPNKAAVTPSFNVISLFLDLIFACLKPVPTAMGFIEDGAIGPRQIIRRMNDGSLGERVMDFEKGLFRWSLFTKHRAATGGPQWSDAPLRITLFGFAFLVLFLVTFIWIAVT